MTQTPKIDLSQCANEPIRIPGQIQPHGQAVSFDITKLCVTGHSANFSELNIGDCIKNWLTHDEFTHLRKQLYELSNRANPNASSLYLRGHQCYLSITAKEAVLEFIPVISSTSKVLNNLELMHAIRCIKQPKGLLEKCQIAAQTIARLSNIDRVMIYQFDEEYNGEVISESKQPHLNSFKGLHFPESDIPKQARALYLQKTIRLIPDVHYQAEDFIRAPSAAPLDMSETILRSVSPIHIQYLKNMKVGATLTCSIIVNDELWGLIACHHYSPYFLTIADMEFFESFALIFSEIISFELEQRQSTFQTQIQTLLSQISYKSNLLQRNEVQTQNLVDDFMSYGDQFKSIFAADAFCLIHQDSVFSHQSLNKRALKQLCRELIPQLKNGRFCTHRLIETLETPDLEYAGAMLMEVQAEEPFYWLWLKREYVHTVNWGGDPNNKVSINEQGQLTPRTSFEAFVQTIQNSSTPWEKQILNVLPQIQRALEQLLEQSSNIQALVSLIDEHILSITLDNQQHIITASKAFCQMIGYDKNEIIQRPFQNLLYAHQKEPTLSESSRDNPWEGEIKYQCKTHDIFWVYATSQPLFNDKNQHIGHTLLQYDITERKKLQQLQELHYFLRLWRKAFEKSGDGVLELYCDQPTLKLSSHLREIIGLSPTQALQLEDWLALTHPEDLAENQQRFEQMQQGKIAHSISEVRLRTQNGEYSWFYQRLLLLANQETQQAQVITAIYTDIDQLKQIQILLQQQKDEFETMFHVSGDGIAILDLNGQFLHTNPAFANLTGYDSDKLIGSSYFSITPPKDIEPFKQTLEHVAKSGQAMNFEQFYNTKEGAVVAVILSMSLMPDRKRLLITAKNITEKLKLEESLRAAKQLAEKASSAKSQFVANMSHDIRTPMNAVINLSNLMLKQPLDGKTYDYAKLINESSNALLGILNDILDLSKIEANRLEVNSEPFQLSTLVTQIDNIFRHSALTKGLELIIDIAEDVPDIINLDRLRLQQVLSNLIGNAIKFTHQGLIHVIFDYIHNEPSPPELEVMIRDTGIGIAADIQNKLFQPFQQADNSTTRKYGGTGLGLVISKKLIELMDGTLQLYSQPNIGTTFSFTLPLEKTHESSTHLPIEHSISQPTSMVGNRVLLVEDNLINQLVAKDYLERIGIEVVTADNGEIGYLLALEQSFDLVLMDLQMPVMGGIEATQKLRAYGYQKPIVALSAAVLENEKQEAFKAGIDGYIIKPIDESAFYGTLVQYLTPSTDEVATDSQLSDTSDGAQVDVEAPNPKRMAFEIDPEFSCESLLTTFNQNNKLLRRILNHFIEQYQNYLPYFQKTLAEPQLRGELLKSLHTLKGTSGNMHAMRLHQASKELEARLKAEENFEREITVFESALSNTIAQAKWQLEQCFRETLIESD